MTWDTQRWTPLPGFPAGVLGGFAVTDTELAAAVLERIAGWRKSLAAALRTGAPPGISEAMRDLLLELLGVREPLTLGHYPYRLSAFPRPSNDPVQNLRNILLWRARIVDFLSDIWDTLGAPTFDLDECTETARAFEPEDMSPDRCYLCLDSVPEGAGAGHFDKCPVQAAWGKAR